MQRGHEHSHSLPGGLSVVRETRGLKGSMRRRPTFSENGAEGPVVAQRKSGKVQGRDEATYRVGLEIEAH